MTIPTVTRTGALCTLNANLYSFGRKIRPTTTALCAKQFNIVGLNYMTNRAVVQGSMGNYFKRIAADTYKLMPSEARHGNKLHYEGLGFSATRQLKKDQRIWPSQHIIKERCIFTSSAYKKGNDKPPSAPELSANVNDDKSGSLKRAEPIHENVLTVPNLLCISRIVASPYLAHVIINNAEFSWALLIFTYAGLTDAVSYLGFKYS